MVPHNRTGPIAELTGYASGASSKMQRRFRAIENSATIACHAGLAAAALNPSRQFRGGEHSVADRDSSFRTMSQEPDPPSAIAAIRKLELPIRKS